MQDPPILYARDLMERALITVSPETSILDIQRLFSEEEIHGAPVVEDDGKVCGVLSSLDLIRANVDESDPDRVQALTAEDVMTRNIVMVSSTMPIAEVAAKMLEHHIHRVLVGDDRMLVGVITSFDLLRVVARGVVVPAAPIRQTGYAR